MKKKILITGAEGFIGRKLRKFLIAKKNYKVFSTYYKKKITGLGNNSIKCDVRKIDDIKKIIKKIRPHYIFHLAAKSHPTYSFKFPLDTLNTNIIGTANLFESVKNYSSKTKIIVACSSAEFGSFSKEELPIDEKFKKNPEHLYGLSKLVQDLLSLQYFKMFKMNICRAIIFNTSGSGKNFDVFQDFKSQIIKQKKNKTILLKVGNINNLRDFSHVDDTVTALYLLMQKGKSGESYIISSNKLEKISNILKIIKKQLNKKIIIKKNKNLLRKYDEKFIQGNNNKIRKLGWSPKKNLRDIVKDILNEK